MNLEKFLDVPTMSDILVIGQTDVIVSHCLALMSKGALTEQTGLLLMIRELHKSNVEYAKTINECYTVAKTPMGKTSND